MNLPCCAEIGGGFRMWMLHRRQLRWFLLPRKTRGFTKPIIFLTPPGGKKTSFRIEQPKSKVKVSRASDTHHARHPDAPYTNLRRTTGRLRAVALLVGQSRSKITPQTATKMALWAGQLPEGSSAKGSQHTRPKFAPHPFRAGQPGKGGGS